MNDTTQPATQRMSDAKTTLAELKQRIEEFRAKRGWVNEDPKDLALSLILEASELLEHFQWLTGEDVLNNPEIKKAIGEEMSDVLWWILSLGQRLDIDVAEAFGRKMIKNAKKYPEDVFKPNMDPAERNRAYYKIKAETRGGHPLHTEDEDE